MTMVNGGKEYHTEAKYIIFAVGRFGSRFFAKWCQEHDIELKNVLEVSTVDLLIEFAKIGMGAACVIKEFVQNDLDKEILVEAPLGLTFPSREIGFVCKKGSENQKLLTQLAEI